MKIKLLVSSLLRAWQVQKEISQRELKRKRLNITALKLVKR